MISSSASGRPTSAKFIRRIFLVATMLSPLSPARAQEPPPRIVFSPALDVAQAFRVSYGVRDVSVASAGAGKERLSVTYRLTATPIAREKDGHRLRLVVSEIERPPAQGGMDMVVAAALMLDGFPVEMLVDARGFMKEVADWPNVQRALGPRADAMPNGYGRIGHSVIDDRTPQQATWPLFPAIEAMNRARSYLDLAERTGASTISWFGSPIDVTVEPANADGAVAMTWLSPSGAKAHPDSQGRAVFRRDGFPAKLTATFNGNGARGPAQYITTIEEIAPR
jgi:hypothetical protein